MGQYGRKVEEQAGGNSAKRAKVAAGTEKNVIVEKIVGQVQGDFMPGKAPTVHQIQKNRITQLSLSSWAGPQPGAFDPELVKKIYKDELSVKEGGNAVPLQRVILLEISQYLEKYLWPNFEAETASFEHVMSIILMVNEKFRENISAWACFHDREAVFPQFFQRVITLQQEQVLSTRDHINYTLFLINCFQSLGDEMVRPQMLRLVNPLIWHTLSPARLKRELGANEALQALWAKLSQREAKAARVAAKQQREYKPPAERPEVAFIPSLITHFLQVLTDVVPPEAGAEVDGTVVLFCERFTELLVDLLSQLPSRKFVHAVVEDLAVSVKCRLSALYQHPRGRLFSQLTDLLRFYEGFEINNHTGSQLAEDEVVAQHTQRICALQRFLFKSVPKLRELALANVSAVEKRAVLREKLKVLSPHELQDLVIHKLHLVRAGDPWADRLDFLTEVMLAAFERRRSQREALNALPLYPNEEVMWDEHLVPSINYTGEGCLALPKLNLQFLTLADYLLRNFNLFRLESTYEIREDVHDVLKRMGARPADGYSADAGSDGVSFTGWARMAVPAAEVRVSEVKPPHIGELKPASVKAEIRFSIARFKGPMRAEWDELKEHDVLFLLCIRPPAHPHSQQQGEGGGKLSVPERFGLELVRGCEIVEVRDESNALMNDFTGRVKREHWKPPQGDMRTVTVALDPAQYQLDCDAAAAAAAMPPGAGAGAQGAAGAAAAAAAAEAGTAAAAEMYASFNVLMRRKPKENNFKAILESIRDLMNEDATVPPWLHDIFLGYGDPADARWTNMPGQLTSIDFKDTFLDATHLRESFPSHQVKFVTPDGDEDASPKPPFRIKLPPPEAEGEAKTALVAEAYVPPEPGPYPEDQPRQNRVRFTPVQVEAIVAGVQPGLTMVVGPPGTGKTDTAVQILHVLYHNCPGQRTLLITHSNQALNDLFEKIMQRDVPARYLLRLGMGEQELDTELKFSREGRVNAMLARRIELLAQVERLAATLKLPPDAAITCETAAHFWLLHVLSRWEAFVATCEVGTAPPPAADAGSGVAPPPASSSSSSSLSSIVRDRFPFREFFADAPGGAVFPGAPSYARDMRAAQGCFRHLKTMFTELEECRAFELLKTTADRSNYLMTRQAKIVAMTCTHAALKRRDFLALGFKYDNLVMEESAQILEIETFIPMVLQHAQDGRARLKRCIMIGDHNQLPPVVKNMAFQKYSHMDQSLFTRFVRLGVPHTQLNAQGRARPSIAKLYNWRYRDLGDLPAVRDAPAFRLANAGFAFDYQLVDVPDYEGRGEFEPNPWFYQNLGEAEYVVSVFQYMRLLGYPAAKISILTTYNGQKHLIRDVIEKRCADNPLFGRPSKVTTVDRFQGQQNDYILLSLVRTKVVGHLRDVRRLVVATSRARLGLYVFCRRALFEQCYELRPTFERLLQRPDRLALVLNEPRHPTTRPAVSDDAVVAAALTQSAHLVDGIQGMAAIVAHKYNAWAHAQAQAQAQAHHAQAYPRQAHAQQVQAQQVHAQAQQARGQQAQGQQVQAQARDQQAKGQLVQAQEAQGQQVQAQEAEGQAKGQQAKGQQAQVQEVPAEAQGQQAQAMGQQEKGQQVQAQEAPAQGEKALGEQAEAQQADGPR